MRTWMRFWTAVLIVVSLLATLSLIYGAATIPSTAENIHNTYATLDAQFPRAQKLSAKPVSEMQTEFFVIWGGVTIGVALPIMLVALFFVTRNRKALIEEERHQELLAAQREHYAPPAPANANVQAQLNLAKQMIQSKQFDHARTLLATIDHPTASTPLAEKLPPELLDRGS